MLALFVLVIIEPGFEQQSRFCKNNNIGVARNPSASAQTSKSSPLGRIIYPISAKWEFIFTKADY